MDENKTWEGRERREGQVEPIHPLRWRLLVVWIVLFSVIVGWTIRHDRQNQNTISALVKSNRVQIDQISRDKATVASLQRTNCGLLRFLLSARKTRWQAYTQSHNKLDLRAVQGYEKLAGPFFQSTQSTGTCSLPKSLLISTRPITTAK